MKNQNNQEEECFVTSRIEQHKDAYDSEQILELENKIIYNNLPEANQIKPDYRPTQMIPRVMKLQPQMSKLPSILNNSCEEILLQTKNSEIKSKLPNKQKLLLSQYLLKKQFYLLYKKHTQSNQISVKIPINDMTIRLRQIAVLSDFDHKRYKQLMNVKTKISSFRDQIDSNFQCGNLSHAYGNDKNPNAYYLLLQQDTNTHGYTNWFFFRFRNVGLGIRKFYILNVAKKTPFYKQGMSISVFSIQKQKQNGLKWHKTGNEISFFQTNFQRNEYDNQNFKCLCFQYNFEYEEDQVYFASTQPYSYSRLVNFLNQIKILNSSNQSSQIQITIQTIGYSISNNIIPAISFCKKGDIVKQWIVFIGRQHPSEMSGSFISQFLIKIFQQQNNYSEFILKKYNIVIVPMANPDGVIYGNSRCNFAGYDLNRHWGNDVIKQMTPQTYKIRSFLCSLQKSSGIAFVMDLHGHGKMLNSFVFCGKNQEQLHHKYFPIIMSKVEERFSLVSCVYGISKEKENTLRAQLASLGVDCYTLENSYYGYNQKSTHQVILYNEDDYYQIAISIVKSLYIFFSTSSEQKQIVKQKFGYNIQTLNEQLYKIVQRLNKQQDINQQDLLSESDPEGDGLELQQRLNICNNNKKLNNKIREQYKKNKKFMKRGKKNLKNLKNNIKKQIKDRQQSNTIEEKQQLSKEQIKILKKKQKSRNPPHVTPASSSIARKIKIQNKIKSNRKQKNSIFFFKQQNDSQQSKQFKNKANFNNNILHNHSNDKEKIIQSKTIPKSTSFTNKNKINDLSKQQKKIHTETVQLNIYSETVIGEQNVSKHSIKQSFCQLKTQSLKNMNSSQFLFLGIKNKRCKWIQKADKHKQRHRNYFHLKSARINQYSKNIENQLSNYISKECNIHLLGKQLKIFPCYSKSTPLKIESEPLRCKTAGKRSCHRLDKFVKNNFPQFDANAN